MIETLLLYVGLPFGGLAAAGAAFVFLTPWGPAVLTFVANSRLARAALTVGAVALAIGLACLKAFKAGKASGTEAIDRANAAAKADRAAIDAAASAESDSALRAELTRWGPE